MSDFYLMTRAAYVKLSRPVARAALRAGFTPDIVTVLGTAASVLAARLERIDAPEIAALRQAWSAVLARYSFDLAVERHRAYFHRLVESRQR